MAGSAGQSGLPPNDLPGKLLEQVHCPFLDWLLDPSPQCQCVTVRSSQEYDDSGCLGYSPDDSEGSISSKSSQTCKQNGNTSYGALAVLDSIEIHVL